LLDVFSEVVLEILPEVDVRVCLRLARLVYVFLVDLVGSLALLQMLGADEGVKRLRFSQ
jgi:hypothetical protein